MRIRTLTAVAAATAAATVALAGCGADTDAGVTAPDSPPRSSSSSASDPGTTTSAASGSPAATPAGGTGFTGDRGRARPPATQEPGGEQRRAVNCGRGDNQLTVWAVGPDCATAIAVHTALGTQRAGGGPFPIKVYIAGHGWGCDDGASSGAVVECSSPTAGAVRLTH